jgi:hypothetical protein
MPFDLLLERSFFPLASMKLVHSEYAMRFPKSSTMPMLIPPVGTFAELRTLTLAETPTHLPLLGSLTIGIETIPQSVFTLTRAGAEFAGTAVEKQTAVIIAMTAMAL